ncbi:MAG: universal stress protein [Armatimonadetes bacterium]|nr:universal stress protein [Armatimonadota bacterium]
MTRVLVGVDTAGTYRPILSLLARMEFENLEIHLLNVMQSFLPDGSFPQLTPEHGMFKIFQMIEEDGRAELKWADKWCEDHGIPARTFQGQGDPAVQLTQHAEKHECQLIAIRSQAKGNYGTLFFGSVAKGLVSGSSQSLLIVKNDHAETGKINAVLATDHSEYMGKCLSELETLNPHGFGKLHVVTAFESIDQIAPKYVEMISGLGEMERGQTLAELDRKNRLTIHKLEGMAESFESEVAQGHPNEAMNAAMKSTSSELLILGAQGHNFFDRMKMGSKSFHQVVAEPHSVLVLRP